MASFATCPREGPGLDGGQEAATCSLPLAACPLPLAACGLQPGADPFGTLLGRLYATLDPEEAQSVAWFPHPGWAALIEPQQHVFVVRIWKEPGPSDPERWRGSVEHVPSGERLYFARLPDLGAFVRRQLGAGAFVEGTPTAE